MGTPMLRRITYGLPLGFVMRDSESLKNGHLLAGLNAATTLEGRQRPLADDSTGHR